MVNNRITKERVRHHFTYGVWKYALLVVVSIFAWDLIYSMTAYRPPADKKIDVYIVQASADMEAFEAAEMPALQEAFADMEAIDFYQIAMGSQDDYAVVMQFTTYIAAQQGDLFLLPYTRAQELGYEGNEGLFISLEPYIESGALDVRDIDLTNGKLSDGRAGRVVCMLPADTLYGLLDYNIDPEGLVLAIPGYSGNIENAVKMMNWFVDRFSTEMPDWYAEYKKTQQEQATQGAQLF